MDTRPLVTTVDRPALEVTVANPPVESGSAIISFSRCSSVDPAPMLKMAVSSFLPDPSVVS